MVLEMPILEGFIDEVSEELSHIGEKLFPNFFSLLVQILALIIMIIIVMVLLYKPVKKTLDARSNAIESEISNAKQNNIESQKNLTESEQSIVDARKKANEIIAQASEIAEMKKAEIIASGEQTVTKMKNDAMEEIEIAKQEAQDEIHNEIVNVALDASKEILQREINEKDNSRLVDDFLKDID